MDRRKKYRKGIFMFTVVVFCMIFSVMPGNKVTAAEIGTDEVKTAANEQKINKESGTSTDSGTNTETGTSTDSGTNKEAGASTDSGTNTGSGISTDSGTNKEADTGITVTPEIIVQEPSLETSEIYMMKGSTRVIEIKNLMQDAAINYSISDNSIAYVSQNGEINAVSAGKTHVIMQVQQAGNTYIFYVTLHVINSINISYIQGKRIVLAKNQSRRIYYTVSPAAFSDYVKGCLVWSSDNPQVAAVDQDGKITAIKTGSARISLSATDGSISGITIRVTVTARKTGTAYSENNLTTVSLLKSRYTYSDMKTDLKELSNRYGDCIRVSVLADTYDKRHIYQVILGNPDAKNKIMVQAAIHGREYMTTLLTMKQIEFYCRNYYSGRYRGRYFSEMFNDTAFYIVPMANPDGVAISQYGASGIRNKNLREGVIKRCLRYGGGRKTYYTYWKGNARGVNLNLNFDANWNISSGTSGTYGYKGAKAESEIESKTLVKLFNQITPVTTFCYHATGSIIYWYYGQTGALKKQSNKLAQMVRSVTSYSRIWSFNKHKSAGFSDWVTIKKKTSAVTIEIGKNACPLNIKEFPAIWSKNRLMYLLYAKYFGK